MNNRVQRPAVPEPEGFWLASLLAGFCLRGAEMHFGHEVTGRSSIKEEQESHGVSRWWLMRLIW